jgi:hypothetical protein
VSWLIQSRASVKREYTMVYKIKSKSMLVCLGFRVKCHESWSVTIALHGDDLQVASKVTGIEAIDWQSTTITSHCIRYNWDLHSTIQINSGFEQPTSWDATCFI